MKPAISATYQHPGIPKTIVIFNVFPVNTIVLLRIFLFKQIQGTVIFTVLDLQFSSVSVVFHDF